jgi:hypothetical protein
MDVLASTLYARADDVDSAIAAVLRSPVIRRPELLLSPGSDLDALRFHEGLWASPKAATPRAGASATPAARRSGGSSSVAAARDFEVLLLQSDNERLRDEIMALRGVLAQSQAQCTLYSERHATSERESKWEQSQERERSDREREREIVQLQQVLIETKMALADALGECGVLPPFFRGVARSSSCRCVAGAHGHTTCLALCDKRRCRCCLRPPSCRWLR